MQTHMKPEVFYEKSGEAATREEREREVRKPLVAGDANLTIMLR